MTNILEEVHRAQNEGAQFNISLTRYEWTTGAPNWFVVITRKLTGVSVQVTAEGATLEEGLSKALLRYRDFQK